MIEHHIFPAILLLTVIFAVYKMRKIDKDIDTLLNKKEGDKKYHYSSGIDGFDLYAMPLVLIIMCYIFAGIFAMWPERRYIFPLLLVIVGIAYLSGKNLGVMKGRNQALTLLKKEEESGEKD